jgi:hypothetical protein
LPEPIHRSLEDDFTGPHGESDDPRFQLRQDFIDNVKGYAAARSRWQCPYCKMLFNRRKPCASHMGMKADTPASCRVLRGEDSARKNRLESGRI